MSTILLIRHAEADLASDPVDPALGNHGVEQAQHLALALSHAYAPMPILSSPRRRARETAALIASQWNTSITCEARFSEMPIPVPASHQRDWLRQLSRKQWHELEPEVQHWREEALSAFTAISADTVIVTHFMLINALVGWVEQQDTALIFEPDNVSLTKIERDSAGVMEVTVRGEDCLAGR